MAQADVYRRQIDALRAIAVIAVLVTHFWDQGTPWGHYGVRLFFVISGYLITLILLRARDATEPGASVRGTLLAFYARRSLRIFPAYLLMLAIAAMLSPAIRETLVWHLTYTTNVMFSLQGTWDPWPIAHLWSLSVEEQFYLMWPFVVLLLPLRSIPFVLVGACALAIGFRASLWHVVDGPALYVLTPAAFDALAAGALLAVWERSGQIAERSIRLLGLVGVVALLVVLMTRHLSTSYSIIYVWEDALIALPMAALVLACSRGVRGTGGMVLNNTILQYVGRISYGVYLFHFPVLAMLFGLCDMIGLSYPVLGLERFIIAGSVTIALAALSWHCFERPIGGLKRFFPYTKTGSRRVDPTFPI